MRGLHWSGEREYIISFNQRPTNFVTIGFGADCDLCLPDPSLSRTHSRIEYKDNGFQVEDLTSSAGTFLKLTAPHRLPVGAVSMFKMGRTMLTVKVERRKLGVLQSWRASRRNRADGSLESPSSRASGDEGVGGGGGGAAAGEGGRRVIAELPITSPTSGGEFDDDDDYLGGSGSGGGDAPHREEPAPARRSVRGGGGGGAMGNLDLPEDVIAVEEYDDGEAGDGHGEAADDGVRALMEAFEDDDEVEDIE